ncbi:TRAP transporter large permease [Thalassospira marina]|uniref:TRAP transporter large permease protein n=1 Tax=Thalassospira marina TaxID=2048283 RepID=A0A2N3KEN5_9PROT|nr:TRAP transporter large permease [Thalassospira marina]AUG55373.1 C4-dicarboxylate ABC transporter permease [Thalassospira marina]PKR49011.1 C4-dicarboxylate ABC transporter permease [Thalassospira marina]
MTPIETGLLGLLCLIIVIMLQVPVGFAMATVGAAGYVLLTHNFTGMLSLFGTETANMLANKDFAVVMLFLLMGGFAGAAGISSDIYRVANAWIGHFRGGLSMATILGCAGFGAIAGSSIATSATMAKIALPEMQKRHYSLSLASGTLAAGGTLGSLIPPSIIMVIYAVQVEQFVVDLFLAAIVPALISVVLFVIAIRIQLMLNPDDGGRSEKMPMRQRMRETKKGWSALTVIVVVMGGIYSGFFTVNEGAGVGLVLTLIFALARGKMTRQSFIETLSESAGSIAMLYAIVIGANIFGYFLTLSHMPVDLAAWVQALDVSPLTVIFALIGMYVVLGCVFDALAGMVLTLPFVVPIIQGLGYDLVWWGIVNVMVIEIGMITPPVGINVFVIKGLRPDISLGTIFRGITPFLIANVIALLLVVLFPQLATWLPSLVK